MSNGRKTGECKWFNSKKGFGFISPSDGSEDVFVHQSAIHAEGFRSLAEKEPVEYETAVDENGRLKALNVTGPGGAHVKGAPKPAYRSYNRYGDDAGGGADGSAPAGDRPPRRGGFGGARGGGYSGGGGRGGYGGGGGRGGFRSNGDAPQ